MEKSYRQSCLQILNTTFVGRIIISLSNGQFGVDFASASHGRSGLANIVVNFKENSAFEGEVFLPMHLLSVLARKCLRNQARSSS
jgi:hypothetical protein